MSDRLFQDDFIVDTKRKESKPAPWATDAIASISDDIIRGALIIASKYCTDGCIKEAAKKIVELENR